MAILIPNMEMPKNCYSCDFGEFYSDGQMYCKRQMRGVMSGLKRPDWCPLVEVKDHRRDPEMDKLMEDAGWE